jgi:hypothetical protein
MSVVSPFLERSVMLLPSEYSTTPSHADVWTIVACLLLGGLFTILSAILALAGTDFVPWSVAKGVLLVASPSLADQNFHQSVVLIVEHGPHGTLGLILNRSTKVLLSEALPNLTVLRGCLPATPGARATK